MIKIKIVKRKMLAFRVSKELEQKINERRKLKTITEYLTELVLKDCQKK